MCYLKKKGVACQNIKHLPFRTMEKKYNHSYKKILTPVEQILFHEIRVSQISADWPDSTFFICANLIQSPFGTQSDLCSNV